jgi:hypothetical protein
MEVLRSFSHSPMSRSSSPQPLIEESKEVGIEEEIILSDYDSSQDFTLRNSTTRRPMERIAPPNPSQTKNDPKDLWGQPRAGPEIATRHHNSPRPARNPLELNQTKLEG